MAVVGMGPEDSVDMHGRVPVTGLVGTWISFTSLGPEPVGRDKPTCLHGGHGALPVPTYHIAPLNSLHSLSSCEPVAAVSPWLG